MRFSRTLLLVISLGAAPAVAHADPAYREWINHCTTGAFQACFSVQVSFLHQVQPAAFPGGVDLYTTTVDIRIANLEGRAGLPASGALDYLSFQGLDVVNIPASLGSPNDLVDFVTPEGGAGPATPGLPAFRPEWFRNPADGYQSGDLIAMQSNIPGYTPIYGCDVPGDNSFGGWQTCSGWLHMGFTLSGTYSFADNTSVLIGGPGGRCPVGQCSAQVTPEPQTIILMATGLSGIAAFRFRRRKRVEA